MKTTGNHRKTKGNNWKAIGNHIKNARQSYEN